LGEVSKTHFSTVYATLFPSGGNVIDCSICACFCIKENHFSF